MDMSPLLKRAVNGGQTFTAFFNGGDIRFDSLSGLVAKIRAMSAPARQAPRQIRGAFCKSASVAFHQITRLGVLSPVRRVNWIVKVKSKGY